MFENLTDKLERSFKILKGEGRITEINIAETLKEIRRALIDADVNYKVAKSFTDEVKQKALGQNVLTAVKPGQMMTKIVRDELAQLMGGTATDIRLEGTPAVILIAGLQGSGKTTFSGKLAAFLKEKKGRHVLLVAGDVYRPAAVDQLKVVGEGVGVPVYAEPGETDVDADLIGRCALNDIVDPATGEVLIPRDGYIESKEDLKKLVAHGLKKVQLRALLTHPGGTASPVIVSSGILPGTDAASGASASGISSAGHQILNLGPGPGQ